MKTYTVHFGMRLTYDVEVEAECNGNIETTGKAM